MWKQGCLGLVLLAGLTPAVTAQVPLTPPVAGGATPLAAPPATQPSTIWDFLGVSKTQRQACKEYICKTQCGQLMNNGLAPLGAVTGGLLGPCCPPFNTDDLNKPADSAEGAAARVKQDEADAKARRLAVRYLSTVDCHYWPEVQDALINSLRTDRNECVRWEAAMAMGTGCCCSKAIIKALAIAVSGSDEDGFPSETSERVKAAASRSLAHCLACASVVLPISIEELPPGPVGPVPRPETAPPAEKISARPTNLPPMEFYQQVRNKSSMEDVVVQARRVQAEAEKPAPVIKRELPPEAARLRDRSLFNTIRVALGGSSPPPAKSAAVGEPKPSGEPPSAPPPTAQAAGEPPAAPPTAATSRVQGAAPAAAPPAAAPPAVQGTAAPALQPPAVREAAPAPATTVTPVSSVAPTGPKPATVPAVWHEQVAVSPAPMPAPPMPPLPNPVDLVRTLQNSVVPEEREWAVNNLSCYDGPSNPQAVQAVVAAARQDPAPLVRAACIRCLVRMNVNTWPVLSAVQALTGDADPRVKHEADRALVKLVPGLGGPGESPGPQASMGSPQPPR
jgi:hypothetical protein